MVWPRPLPLRVAPGKIVVPELPVEFTPRPQLRQRLDEATPAQVVVVSAPAGSGKTLLLADWVRHDPGPETAWISLDADDNDPRRLWSTVVISLLALPSSTSDRRLRRVVELAAHPHGADLVEELADALDALHPPVRVVLDDVHELTGREVLRDLTPLVRHPPAGRPRPPPPPAAPPPPPPPPPPPG